MSDPGAAPREIPFVQGREARIPALGLGTWQVTGAEAEEMVGRALELGYRHLDTAQAYGNEAEVGRAVEDSGVDRDSIFITTKVWPDRYGPGDFADSVDASLEALRTDAVDLLLLHWPAFGDSSLEEVMGRLAEARRAGKARHVGVSNFTPGLLDRAVEASPVPLEVNQVEYHPFLGQSHLLDAVRGREMVLTAYSPLAQGRTARDPLLKAIGRERGKTGAQVALRWLLQQESVATIPRTSDPEHLAENLDVFDFRLSKGEMEAVGELAEPDGRIIDPDGLAPEWEG